MERSNQRKFLLAFLTILVVAGAFTFAQSNTCSQFTVKGSNLGVYASNILQSEFSDENWTQFYSNVVGTCLQPNFILLSIAVAQLAVLATVDV